MNAHTGFQIQLSLNAVKRQGSISTCSLHDKKTPISCNLFAFAFGGKNKQTLDLQLGCLG